MSLANAVFSSLEARLPRVIDARTHGIIDYGHASFFLGMALVCRKQNPRAAVAALLTGSFVLIESLLTDYPLGVKRVIPFATHGRMDAGLAAVSPMMPRLFGFQGTGAADVFTGKGFVEATVVGLTDFDSARARAESREG